MEIDFLIIGQGLAGSLLAWELIQRQQKVIIVDNNQLNASQVAAGLINPVTGMRFVKSPDIEFLLPFARQYYHQLEVSFKQSFYIEKPMWRLLRHNKEKNAAEKRLQSTDYQDYLGEIIPATAEIKAEQGVLVQKQTGYLLTQKLLAALKSYFISKNAFLEQEIQHSEIQLDPVLSWKHYHPKKIIFAEGHYSRFNPWFSYLPFQPVKGEIITATAEINLLQSILNYGHWFIPLENRQFRTGASFEHKKLDTEISATARNKLSHDLQQVYPGLKTFHIDEQLAGIRPTTLDKMPFIGAHPKYNELIIFNGFGAKGSLQIPWHCDNLASFLIHQQALAKHSNIKRYHTLFDG